MKRYEIKCELFTTSNDDGKRIVHKLGKAKIIGKNLFISQQLDGYNTPNDEFYDEYIFEYSYNIPFDHEVEDSKKSKKKLNVKINYAGEHNHVPFNQTCYTHFTLIQRLINSFTFRKLWIQQPANMMWIINLEVAVFAIILSYCHKC